MPVAPRAMMVTLGIAFVPVGGSFETRLRIMMRASRTTTAAATLFPGMMGFSPYQMGMMPMMGMPVMNNLPPGMIQSPIGMIPMMLGPNMPPQMPGMMPSMLPQMGMAPPMGIQAPPSMIPPNPPPMSPLSQINQQSPPPAQSP